MRFGRFFNATNLVIMGILAIFLGQTIFIVVILSERDGGGLNVHGLANSLSLKEAGDGASNGLGVLMAGWSSKNVNKVTSHTGRKFESSVRVAVVVPYVGTNLPAWFDSFLYSAEKSGSLFDWLIFITDDILRPVPANVKLIKISREQFYDRLQNIDLDFPPGLEEYGGLGRLMDFVIHEYSFSVVEFKPLWGSLFQDYLQAYTHWAFADIDVYTGRMDYLVNTLLLEEFDIYTVSFGDSYRLYLRGQLTIHKNNEYVNNLWRECEHLSKFGYRLLNFYKNSEHRKNDKRWRWPFQSAEGCYSKVAIDNDNVSVYVAAGQLSDAYGGPSKDKEVLVLGGSVLRCYESPLVIQEDKQDLLELYDVQGESGIAAGENRASLAEAVEYMKFGMIKLRRTQLNCEYWIERKYQICLDHIKGDVDIVSQNGVVYFYPEKKFYVMKGGKCREGLIMHFQGWKRNYFSFTTRLPSPDAHFFVIGEFGHIPLRNPQMGVPSFAQHSPDSFQTSQGRVTAQGVANFLPLSSPDESTDISTRYCLEMNEDLKKCKTFIRNSEIRTMLVNSKMSRRRNFRPLTSSGSTSSSIPEVTLIVTCLRDDIESGRLDHVLENWEYGPKVVVVGKKRDYFGQRNPYKSMNCLSSNSIVIEVDLSSGFWGGETLPTSTLLNIGLDAASTDIVFLCPNCAEIRFLFGVGVEKSSSSFMPSSNGLLKIINQISVGESDNASNGLKSPVAIAVPILFSALKSSSTAIQDPSKHTSVIQNCREKILSLTLSLEELMQLNAESDGDAEEMQAIEYTDKDGRVKNVKVKFKDTVKHSLGLRSESVLDKGILPLPLIFNRTQSVHGGEFVRFPEEMNGKGCYGAVYMQSLTGAGYSLHWPKKYQESSSDTDHYPIVGTMSSEEKRPHCSCKQSKQNADAVMNFLRIMRKYYERAQELRERGISDVYTKEKFGTNFEEDQRNMKERQNKIEMSGEI